MPDSTQLPTVTTVVAVADNFNRAGLHPYEFRLYAHLVRATNSGKRTCTEGQTRIARICKMNSSTVRKYLRQLSDRNLIQVNSGTHKREPCSITLASSTAMPFLHQVLDEFGIQPYVFRVYVYLAGAGNPVQISLGCIAADCLMGKKSVQSALQTLQQLGLIVLIERKKGKPACYQLTPHQTWKVAPMPLKHTVKLIRGIGCQRNSVAALKQNDVNVSTQRKLDQVIKQLERAQAALRVAKQTFEEINF